MENIKQKIRNYAILIGGFSEGDELLSFVVEDVVDRALAYMNRSQLIDGYEHFLEDEFYTSAYTENLAGDKVAILPIPVELERPLATVVVLSYKTIQAKKDGLIAIKRMSDNGQEVEYLNKSKTFMASQSDDDIFSSIVTLMNKFRLITVIENR